MSLFSGNAVAHLIFQSDWVSKAVLGVLFTLSVICWTIFVHRFFVIRLTLQQLKNARRALSAVTTLDQLKLTVATFQQTYPGLFLGPAYGVLTERIQHKTEMNSQEKEFFSQQLFSLYDELIKKESSYLVVFTTTAEVATLLGLFGTIWGLIHSFIRISERQSADIVTVAPGIAEALITTLAGLLVAIPTIVLYHALLTKVRAVEDALLGLAERFEMVAKKLWEREINHAPLSVSATEKPDNAASQSYATY